MDTEQKMVSDDAAGAVPKMPPVGPVVIVSLIYLAFSILLPIHRFEFHHIGPLVGFLIVTVPTVLFMLLQLTLSLSLVRLSLSPGRFAILGVVGLIAWFLVLRFFSVAHPTSYEQYLVVRVTRFALLGLTETFAITCFGAVLSRIIRERSLLLPVALIAMPIDYIGAMTPSGFTHDMVAHAGKIVDSVSVSVPAVTVHGMSVGPLAFIGPGDVLFMAMFFAAVRRFELAEKKTFWWMFALLSISMIIAIRFFPVAALVPMGLAVIIANANQVKLKREEAFAVLYAGGLILILVCLFYWSTHHYLFHHHH